MTLFLFDETTGEEQRYWVEMDSPLPGAAGITAGEFFGGKERRVFWTSSQFLTALGQFCQLAGPLPVQKGFAMLEYSEHFLGQAAVLLLPKQVDRMPFFLLAKRSGLWEQVQLVEEGLRLVRTGRWSRAQDEVMGQLQKGSRGAGVMALKQLLQELEPVELPMTGVFDTACYNALTCLQRKLGHQEDGICEERLWKALVSAALAKKSFRQNSAKNQQ